MGLALLLAVGTAVAAGAEKGTWEGWFFQDYDAKDGARRASPWAAMRALNTRASR